MDITGAKESDGSTLTVTTLRVPCARIGAQSPLPQLDGTLEAPFELGEEVPESIRRGMSYGRPRSLHPYLMQDRYTRERRDTDLTCVVLENDCLRAELLPELGGRLWSLVDQVSGRELLYRNRVVQPANLGLRNAWFAGGVEWNIGTRGHSPLTAAPLHTAVLTGPDGTPTLRMWEYERLRGVVFQVDVRLPAGSRVLYVYVRIRNPGNEDVPMYWWSNAAVPEHSDVRVLAPADRAFATSYDGTVRVVDVPGGHGTDPTWPTRGTDSADHFFDLEPSARPWIAAVDGSGHGLAQVSTRRLAGRKLFCWGTGAGGRRWQQWLSPEGGDYLEIQAGLAPTQFEHTPMPPGAAWSWVEAYGDLAADASRCHGDDWAAATSHTADRVDALASRDALEREMGLASALADVAPEELICEASGWGALEGEARGHAGVGWVDETGTPFPTGSIGPEQQPWRDLLGGADAAARLTDADPGVPPPSYVLGDVWTRLLSRCRPSWARDYHLAVLAHASGDLGTARSRYADSLAQRPSAWAQRGLAVVAREVGEAQAAARMMRDAVDLAPRDLSILTEAVAAALDAADAAAALELVDSAPPDLRSAGRLRLLEARAALAVGDQARAAAILDAGLEVPDIREGDTALSDLWQWLYPQRPVPSRYDFRMRATE